MNKKYENPFNKKMQRNNKNNNKYNIIPEK